MPCLVPDSARLFTVCTAISKLSSLVGFWAAACALNTARGNGQRLCWGGRAPLSRLNPSETTWAYTVVCLHAAECSDVRTLYAAMEAAVGEAGGTMVAADRPSPRCGHP